VAFSFAVCYPLSGTQITYANAHGPFSSGLPLLAVVMGVGGVLFGLVMLADFVIVSRLVVRVM
jgi:hypothetical protein